MTRVRPFDLVFLLVAVAVTVFISIRAYAGDSRYLSVHAREGEWIYPLDEDATISIPGPLGESVIEIHDGSAHFVESPCRNKLCIIAGPVSFAGDWAACLPNGVLIEISGDDDRGVDALVY